MADTGLGDAEQGQRDEVTMRMLLSRDPEGLVRLLADHADRVMTLLRAEFGKVLDQQEIEDAISQASQAVWEHCASYRPDRGSLRAWYFVIARNAGRRLLRARAIRAECRGDLAAAPDPASLEGPSLGRTGNDPLIEDLRRCIGSLPPLQRDVILADLAAGGIADSRALAKSLGTSPRVIYACRSAARRTLRRELRIGQRAQEWRSGAGQAATSRELRGEPGLQGA
ncbi:MAG: hypothetical protein Fur0037_11560 [Planctomycetota bacterium]